MKTLAIKVAMAVIILALALGFVVSIAALVELPPSGYERVTA